MRLVPLRAAIVMASIYGYFLIFAQFSFVELVRNDYASHPLASLSAGTYENVLLGAMALAGILAGFWTAWKGASPVKIRIALFIAAIASLVAPWAGGGLPLILISLLTGIGVGVSTVSAAALLRSWCGLLWAGLGTGFGYACCNLPFVFSQSPAHQAWIATGFAGVGALCVPPRRESSSDGSNPIFPFASVLVLFTALVWTDSASFFIIQHTRDLKDATWNDAQLWRNATIHLASALLAGVWLKRGGARTIPATAWILLAVAALAVNVTSGREPAGWIYPMAVSLYSTALVVWPGWFCGAHDERAAAWKAAWIYAVAGWFGSANGIGMAQSLHRVPQEFIVIAGISVAAAILFSKPKYLRIGAVLAVVLSSALWPRLVEKEATTTPAQRGKQVYLSEGCIHCHSQFVRPGTKDEEYWGPVPDNQAALPARPVLIGNRRQGPDLTNIGARRSTAWLKLHFIQPDKFSHGTPMPSYAHLFEDSRGDDLVAYMQECGKGQLPKVLEKIEKWEPSGKAPLPDGAALFASQCAVCHGPEGRGNGQLASLLAKPPANLRDGPFIWSPRSPDMDLRISRIIKFGIPGTDMPGHETLSDSQVSALAKYILEIRK